MGSIGKAGKEMKTYMRRLVSAVAALALVALVAAPFGPAPSAWGDAQTATLSNHTASVSAGNGGGTITIHLPKLASSSSSNTAFNYKVYKVFDATVSGTSDNSPISYKLMSDKTDVPNVQGTGNRYIKDDSNNVYYGTVSDDPSSGAVKVTINNQTKYVTVKTGEMTSAEATAASAAIKTYLNLNGSGTAATPVVDVNVSGMETSGTNDETLVIRGLDYGYYYVTTDVGSAIALTSTNPNASIQSKNDVPHIDKTITNVDSGSVATGGKNAIAALGSTVSYQSAIHVKKGATNYVFKDTLGSGLTLDTSSITVQSRVGGADPSTVTSGESTYTLTTTASTSGDDQYTFKITFVDNFVSGLANQLGTTTTSGGTSTTIDDVQILVSYKATVTDATLQTAKDAGKNSATISYGGTENNPAFTSTPSTTQVYNALLKVLKTGSDNQGLAGAQFVIKNANDKYYRYTSASGSTPATVTWVDSLTGENGATVLTSDSNGNVINSNAGLSSGFAGLADGTYTLVETEAPSGYNKADDSTFTVSGASVSSAFDSSNLTQEKTVVNRSSAVLPTTGGTGTMAFYILGAALVIAAGIALVVRRRLHQEN